MKSLHCCLLGCAAADCGSGDACFFLLLRCPLAAPCPLGLGRGLCPPAFLGLFHATKALGLLLMTSPCKRVDLSMLFRSHRCGSCGVEGCVEGWLLLSNKVGRGLAPIPGEPGGIYCPGPAAKQSWERQDRLLAVLSAS